MSDEGASLDGFSQLNASFSSEAGEVLTFFGYFLASRQKSDWGLGQSPIRNNVGLYADNYKKYKKETKQSITIFHSKN
ncbi:MAG: hypothetical protein QM800_00570 [Paludibacter sp.]